MLLGAALIGSPGALAGTSTLDGIYSGAQAELGLTLYTDHCEMCHAPNFTGNPGAPPLIGPEFTFNWDGMTMAALFDYVKTMMPPGEVGSLSDQEYIDTIATILQANGFPAMEGADLPTSPDALAGLSFQRPQ
jgi:polar amino acid transport system substrate-binding protein